MSEERNYRLYVIKYFSSEKLPAEKLVTKESGVQLQVIADALGLKPNVIDATTGELKIPEFNFRAKISQKIGEVEEDAHDTQKIGGQGDFGQRIKAVPESNMKYHERLQSELYKLLTPSDV